MPDTCCAVGCCNRRSGHNSTLPFYRIPSGKSENEKRRRICWLRAIRRKDWTEEQISRARICGKHFISGKRCDNPEDPDWTPSIFTFVNAAHILKKSHEKKRKDDRYKLVSEKRSCKTSLDDEVNVDEYISGIVETDDLFKDVACQSDDDPREIEINSLKLKINELNVELNSKKEEIDRLKVENKELKEKSQCFGFGKIKSSDKWINFFTGLATLSLFTWVVDRVNGSVSECHKRLSVSDHVLIVLMKLRLGLLNEDIAHRFNLRTSVVSNVYRKWLPAVSGKLQNLIIWPSRISIRQNLPAVFKSKFRDVICTIDCSEVFIARPSNLTARAQTWSNYKHNNTIKYLIGITPAGAVSFLSCGWGGRVSDKEITLKSGFLEKLCPGDCVLADIGFLISREISQRGAFLRMPSFTKGKKQLSAREVDESRQLAHIRIHVERVIGRLKNYRILQTIIPISKVDLLDQAMVVISACINLNKSIVGKKDES